MITPHWLLSSLYMKAFWNKISVQVVVVVPTTMEKIIAASTEKIWVFCTLASFVGCLALTLCLNITSGSLIFWSVQSAEQQLNLPDDYQLNMTTGLVSTFPSVINSSFEDLSADVIDVHRRSNTSFEGLNAGNEKARSQRRQLNTSMEEFVQPCQGPNAGIEGQVNDTVAMEFHGQGSTENIDLNYYSNSSIEGRNTSTTESQGCNIMDGFWEYDDGKKASPLYHGWQCPFLGDQVSCQRNGRSDFEYEKWSWEAKDCRIPRFNGTDMLERLRGKRVVIAGDSLNRNQWESLACLLYSSIPASSAHVDYKSSVYKVFRAKEYDCSVEFFWAPFLIQLDVHPKIGNRILRLDRLISSVKLWKGADIMVFNTGHWWVHSGKSRAWDFFEHKGKLLPEMSTESALEIAMATWARWIDKNVDPNKTTVYFRSISPEHKGTHWCYNQTKPLRNESFEYNFPRPILQVIAKTLNKMKTPVRYLNITKLSGYRKDAHPSIYARKDGHVLMKKNDEELQYKGDCSHWCLPGVPDTWNRLIYADMVTGYLKSSLGSSS